MKEQTWKLGTDGFVCEFMTAGPVLRPYSSSAAAQDQLQMEALMRREISTKKPYALQDYFDAKNNDGRILLGKTAPCGAPWKVYIPGNTCFVDVSEFYSTLQEIHMDIAALLRVKKSCQVLARVWTFMSVGIYLNGKKVGGTEYPVYKPMESADVTLDLSAGDNLLYFVCDNLGARDTRNILGIQILGDRTSSMTDEETRDAIQVILPDVSLQNAAFEGADFLAGIREENGKVLFPHNAPAGVSLEEFRNSSDLYRKPGRVTDCSGMKDTELLDETTDAAVTFVDHGFTLRRVLEFAERKHPVYMPEKIRNAEDSKKQAREAVFASVAEVRSLDRGGFGFSIMNILARRYLADHCPKMYAAIRSRMDEDMPDSEREAVQHMRKGEDWEHWLTVSEDRRAAEPVPHIVYDAQMEKEYGLSAEDRKLLFDDLDNIEQRVDCADFEICGLIRYMKNYRMDPELSARTEQVLLSFRYWMNEKGSDAMCFWSENHSLMFYSCAMFVGQMYPDAYFEKAQRTGTELSGYGRRKVLDWLEDVETYGFEEFQSMVYVNVTLAALLNLVDYAEPQISERAYKITDRLILDLCRQSFHGTVISPMGRVYRSVLHPFQGGTQSIISQLDPSAPFVSGEGWMSYLCTSKYRWPEKCGALLNRKGEDSYETGNALVRIAKTDDYVLTSVQSPRTDDWKRWRNIRIDGTEDGSPADPDTHEYNKSLNECFHGTSCFQPGTHGYQQHMWMAALDAEAVLFANHPGPAGETSGMRPGYWNGNGVMPAVNQEKRALGAIYHLPEPDPCSFIHIYCPVKKFDETKQEKTENGTWLFLRKKNGYLALWCSGKLAAWNDQLMNCELRVYGTTTAILVIAGSSQEDGDFDSFTTKAKACRPVFDRNELLLRAALPWNSNWSMKWVSGSDRTQFIP